MLHETNNSYIQIVSEFVTDFRWVALEPKVVSKWVDGETTYVILHGLFGGVELLVIRAAARLMN